MNNTERAEEWLEVVGLIGRVQDKLNNLAVGDVTIIPSEIKHALDEPREWARTYARLLYQDAPPASFDDLKKAT